MPLAGAVLYGTVKTPDPPTVGSGDPITASELQGVLGEWEGGPQSAERRISLADLNRDGKLSDDELRPAMDLRFKLMDKNKDGNIDLDELQTGFGVPMLHRGRN